MDVPPCNTLFDLWLDTMVLSKTLNCSLKRKRRFESLKAEGITFGLFLVLLLTSYHKFHRLLSRLVTDIIPQSGETD